MSVRNIIRQSNVTLLCTTDDPLDDLRLKRIINVPKRGIGDKSVATAEMMAIASGYPLLQFIRHAQDYKAIPTAAAKGMEEFAKLIEDLREQAAEKPVSELIRTVVEITGYGKMLAAAGPEESDRLDNIAELISSAVQYEQSTESPSLSEFLEDVALVSDVDKYDESADAVVLMTIHSAKGLEFPIVFLPGMEEGLFPGHQSIMQPDEIEEERRLAYVALTRAKKKLYITHVHDRMINGSTQFNQLSRFAEEIPPELVEESDASASSQAVRVSFGQNGRSASSFGSTSYGGYPKTSFGTPKRPAQASRPQARPATVAPAFSVGDRVKHGTFGVGTILSVRAMGADTLYEIAFDDVGTKKLMATYAKLTKAAE